MIRRAGQRIRRISAVNWLLAGWSAIVFVFLFAPIVTAVLYSFNQGILGRQTSDFTGFTTQWYSAAWSNGALRHSITISFKVAICTAVLAGVLGTITGFVLARHRGRVVRVTLEVLVYLLLIVRARVVSIDRSTEEAAADLGANRRQTFWDVTLPQVRLAVLAGMLLAFTFSFDDLVISLFLSTPTVTTLPVYLFGSVQLGVRPDVYAIASLMLAFTLVLLAASAVVYRWQRRQEGSRTSLLPGMAGGALPQTALGGGGSA